MAHAEGARAAVDASGEALVAALLARPDLACPGAAEAALGHAVQWAARSVAGPGNGVLLPAEIDVGNGMVGAVLDPGRPLSGETRATEFVFLDRTVAPSLEEQGEAYAQVFAAFGTRRVVVRTLDVGADKPLPYLRRPEEPNPALGCGGSGRPAPTAACSASSCGRSRPPPPSMTLTSG